MRQTVGVLLILLGASLYLVRSFLRAYRHESSACGACTACCSYGLNDTRNSAQTASNSPTLTCREANPHDHEARS